jgi:AcrR family transcriptional regulator
MNTKQHIIDATERIIQLKGLARVTTKEIAREADCAEGTLYKYFEHKEDVFLTLIQRHLPTFIETLSENLVDKGTVRENLASIMLAAIRYYRQVLPLAASFFADMDLLVRHREMLQKLNAGPHRIYERVALYIENEQKLGRITDQVDAMSIVTLLLGGCFQHIFFQQFLGEDSFSLTDEQLVANLLDTLSKGLQSQD